MSIDARVDRFGRGRREGRPGRTPRASANRFPRKSLGNTRLPPSLKGITLFGATSINDLGQIIAFGATSLGPLRTTC